MNLFLDIRLQYTKVFSNQSPCTSCLNGLFIENEFLHIAFDDLALHAPFSLYILGYITIIIMTSNYCFDVAQVQMCYIRQLDVHWMPVPRYMLGELTLFIMMPIKCWVDQEDQIHRQKVCVAHCLFRLQCIIHMCVGRDKYFEIALTS